MTRKPKTKAATKTASRRNKPSRTTAAKAPRNGAAKARKRQMAKTPKRSTSKARTHAAAQSHDPVESLIGAGTRILALPLEPEWKEAISFHLRLILRQAALVDSFELSDEAEPGPVFRA